MDDKSLITWGDFPFSPCQRVFFLGFWMQEDRKILADRPVAERKHFLDCRTHHDIIPVMDWPVHDDVADAAANTVDFHNSPCFLSLYVQGQD